MQLGPELVLMLALALALVLERVDWRFLRSARMMLGQAGDQRQKSCSCSVTC